MNNNQHPKISLFWPAIYKQEWLEELGKVFSTRWIGQGPLVDEFEKQFGQKFGFEYCLSVNSGTSALELAYHLIDIRPGDEVLTPVFTCTATNIPLARRDAKLVFLDVNDQLLVDYDDLKQKISAKTKALVVATIGGIRIEDRVFELAKEYGVPVVIDAAQSVGIPEPQGDYICYSFQAIKHFTTADGGMLVVRGKDEYERAKKIRWFGIDREAKKRANWKWTVNHQMAMDIEELGYKYQMNDVAAAMGLVGLRHSDETLRARQLLCKLYEKCLPNSKLIFGDSCWLIAIVTERRDELMDRLEQNGIESDMVQIRNDAFSVFGQAVALPKMAKIEDKYLYLPLHPNLTAEDIEYIASIINQPTSTDPNSVSQEVLKIGNRASCKCTFYHNGKAKVMIIDSVEVNEGYRRQGLGTKLIEKAIELAKSRGVDSIELNVNHDNIAAKKLYLKTGFAKTNKEYHRLILNKF